MPGNKAAKATPIELTTTDVCEILGVTPMTVYLYRMGRVAGKSKLPCRMRKKGTERHSVHFVLATVLAWARKNSVEVSNKVLRKWQAN